ncbi:MAG: diguanylate cyclase [Rhodocyclaceae bacterium]|nr:diguanylate cyclase [Rhodocyclaceae bacterium]MBX3669117.1 diguanylate cyclase [Rhodocyclaceae bacterium]
MTGSANVLQPDALLLRRKVYPLLVGACYALLACVCLALGYWAQLRTDENLATNARGRGESLFRLIELTRDWNAAHGGVYVPVTAATPPNPYLAAEGRDLRTVDGKLLTLVNPAYMTRQIGELAERVEGIRLHITSLKPLRPANAPDAWEAEALATFEQGARAAAQLVETGDAPYYRYMAPLHVKAACLNCHLKQGYKEGDVRGGISVTIPAADYLATRQAQRTQAWTMLAGSFSALALLLHYLLARTRQHFRAMREVHACQDRLIEQRTAALAAANLELHREIGERHIAAVVFESAAEGIIVTDGENRIVRVNPAFSAITGYTPSEVLGRNPRLLQSGRQDRAFYTELWRSLQETGRWDGEIWNRRKDGSCYVQWMSVSVLPEGGGARYVATFSDITVRKQAEETYRHRAHHDHLTELPNRSMFEQHLQAAIAAGRRYGRPFALLYVDLDHFKEVNDQYGHAAGDKVLIEAARRLSAAVRESDLVARLGGDEFVVILSQIDGRHEAEEVALRIRVAMEQKFQLDGGSAYLSASIGVALSPEHGADAETLIRNADAALYGAKRADRNTYRVFEPTFPS